MKLDTKAATTASGIDITTLRNWRLHSEFSFGTKGITGSWSHTLEDVYGLALVGEMVRHGLSPRFAMRAAKSIIARAGNGPFTVVASSDETRFPVLITEDALASLPAIPLILIPLDIIRQAVNDRMSRRVAGVPA